MTRDSRARAGFVLALLIGLFASDAAQARQWQEEDFYEGRTLPSFSFVPPGSNVPLDQVKTVVGEISSYKATKGDTFYDIARYYGLGINEITAANPGIDEWIPDQTSESVAIPQRWILPCCDFTGIIVNIPEMRIYYYPAVKKGQPRTVTTVPVGLGRTEWRTPRGKFRITEKTVNPKWVIPESIRKERIADKGYSETFIAGGAPDNPLGKYRMRTSLDLYGIHGTNIPWGVGMFVSHGCIRTYPEDIALLYPRIPSGTPGEFIYETVKAGLDQGRVYVEVHDDIYGYEPGPWRHAIEVLKKQNLLERVDEQKLMRAVQEKRGIPVDVTLDVAQAPSEEIETEVLTPPPSTSTEGDVPESDGLRSRDG